MENQKKSKEDAKIEPWTSLAKYKHRCEQHLAGIAGLPLVILRAAIVYGPGDTSGIGMLLAFELLLVIRVLIGTF